MSNENIIWNIIDKLFTTNKNIFVNHHLDSYNDFFFKKIYNIFNEKNPILIQKDINNETKEFNYIAELFLGGLNGDKIYYGKPIIYDENREHFMFPNEARLRNMTYAITIHIDIVIKYKIMNQDKTYDESSITLEKIYLGRFPIMLNSKLCILNNLDKNTKFIMGECKNDNGGYFIIDGKEKTIISQEKFADNMIYIKDNHSELYSHSAEIRCVSEDSSKPIRTLSIRIVRPTDNYTNNNIVVNIPNVRKPIPLFILMRALGIESDKEIIQYCLLDMKKYLDLIDFFIPCVHDSGSIFNQNTALKYISTFTKNKTIPHTLEILTDYLLPNIGEMNFINKAYFIGFMVLELLFVYHNVKKPTDRDNFKYKRIELSGSLIYDLFKEYYTLQQKHIFQKIDKEYYYKQGLYQDQNFKLLIQNNYKEIFKERVLENGFKKAFKGSWGSEEHTKRPEVIQDLNRLSYNSFISHLRKINLPMDSSAKIIPPRLCHSSQWGIIDPLDTPDGGNVGLHKHLALAAHITTGFSSYKMIKFLRNEFNIEFLEECSLDYISNCCKIFVNGSWIGITNDPVNLNQTLKYHKRLGIVSVYTSISWNINDNIIYIYCDEGRLTRPVFNFFNNKPSFFNETIQNKLINNNFNLYDLIIGFNKIRQDINYYDLINKTLINDSNYLYNTNDIDSLKSLSGIIDYLDSAETECTNIVTNIDYINKYTTHLEIHSSLILGIMGNMIVHPEHNQLPRDLFSCGQSKQAVSLYNTNYQNRIDKMGVVINYGQIPLLKSRYLKYINNEEHPYGVNTIVAIGSFNGYNVEDSIIFNAGSVRRGLFNTTYFNMYESKEEVNKTNNTTITTKFADVDKFDVINKKPGYDYSNLNEHGLIKENTIVDDKQIIIGKIKSNPDNLDNYIDQSILPKKGQLGVIDKAFITDGEEGTRIAKVKIREERIPSIGDKFCSRCGQKGTMGIMLNEEDMPFTQEGIRPDIIINPHALPSRMTIGQLIETLSGKVCSILGGFGDCTAFINNGPKHEFYSDLLQNLNYSSTGNEIFYNGETGEQLDMELFVGPCYYMRLKHMVKDKINYRARGPRTSLTRQTVQGRANDGGLRIGEMERDGIIAHGASIFLKESMLNRGDDYSIAVCNNTGFISIYNENKDIFISPYLDGPIKFKENIQNNFNIDFVTKFGRNFSIIRIPYAFKLLIHELMSMNVSMRIITEDNINIFESMNYKNSIDIIKNLEEYKSFFDKDNVTQKTNEPSIKNPNDNNNDTNNVNDKDNHQDKDNDEGLVNDNVEGNGENGNGENDNGENDNGENGDDDYDGLSPETIASIKKAEEYAKQENGSDDDSDEGSKPPISIGKIINTSDIYELNNTNPNLNNQLYTTSPVYPQQSQQLLPFQNSQPIQTLQSIQTLQPIQTSQPIQILQPIQTQQPVNTLQPVQTITQSNIPSQSNVINNPSLIHQNNEFEKESLEIPIETKTIKI